MLCLLLSSCGYKLVAHKSNSVPSSTTLQNGNNYCIVRADSLNVESNISANKIYSTEYLTVQEDAAYNKFELPTSTFKDFKTIKLDFDNPYTFTVFNYNDLIFEFSLQDLYNFPKPIDVRFWFTAFPPWVIGLMTQPIYIKKKTPYLIGQLKVFLSNGELVGTYQNYEDFEFKMRGSACSNTCYNVKEFITKGLEGLKNNLTIQFNQDSTVQKYIIAKQKLLSLTSIADINQQFFQNYYSKLLFAYESNAEQFYGQIKSKIEKEFKKNRSDDEEIYIVKAFNRYSGLKTNRLLIEQGRNSAEAFIKNETKNFNDFWQQYNTSKNQITANRERLNLLLSTAYMSLTQTAYAYTPSGSSQQTTAQLIQVFANALQQNIAINYPNLNVNPNNPSLFTPISQAAVNNDLDKSLCSEAQQIACSNQADSDPTYQSWAIKLATDPREYYALQAAIARCQATLNYCVACLNGQQKAAIINVINDCNNRLSLLASDKYVSSIKPNHVQSILPPGYGFQTANEPLSPRKDNKTKVSTKVN